mgnify:CR=1 FL=1
MKRSFSDASICNSTTGSSSSADAPTFAICTITKDPHRFERWLDYYRDLGASHVFLRVEKTPEVDALRPTLAHFYELVDVKHLSCLGLQGTEVRDAVAEEYFRFRFASACTKLHIFNLTRFRAVLYLDADMIVLRSPAPVLERARWLTEERPLAAGPEVIAPSLFNAGAMLVRPSAAR